MYCLNLKSTDPYFNLAVDEYLLKQRHEDFLVISVNDRSVVTGKHQVAHRELSTGFAFENSIPLIRRISGGGTVFHDEGNLNFSFILNSTVGKQIDFRKYTLPVIAFLDTLGVKASLEEKRSEGEWPEDLRQCRTCIQEQGPSSRNPAVLYRS